MNLIDYYREKTLLDLDLNPNPNSDFITMYNFLNRNFDNLKKYKLVNADYVIYYGKNVNDIVFVRYNYGLFAIKKEVYYISFNGFKFEESNKIIMDYISKKYMIIYNGINTFDVLLGLEHFIEIV